MDFVSKGTESLRIAGLRAPAAALLAAKAAQTANRPVLCITAGESQAARLAQDMELFSPLPVYHYPGYEIPPYTPLSPDPATTALRLDALYHISTSVSPYLVTSSVEALLRKVIPAATLNNAAELIISGEEIEQNRLTRSLAASGYEQMNLVQNAGDYSLRGDILDIFPPGFSYPIRINFFGDFVETIRLFDPISQRSVREISEAEIIPVSDILYPAAAAENNELRQRLQTAARDLNWPANELTAIDEKISQKLKFPGIEFFLPIFHTALSDPINYLPPKTLVLLLDPPAIKRSCGLVWERISANYEAAVTGQAIIPPEQLFLSQSDLSQRFKQYKACELHDFESVDIQPVESGKEQPDGAAAPTQAIKINSGNHNLLKQHLNLQRKKHGLLPPLAQSIRDWLNQGDHIHIACCSERHRDHLCQMLGNYDLTVAKPAGPPKSLHDTRGIIQLYPHPLSAGFDLLDEQVHFLSETELFGENRLLKPRKKKKVRSPDAPPLNFEQLQLGDIVVHSAHGLGIYEGIINMKMADASHDFLQISYKDNDKLYVPMERINTVSKYNGISDNPPAITRLGSKSWSRAKKKVQEAVWKVAQSLLNLYARRQTEKGTAFSRPDSLFQEFEESFPYDEAPGQIKAINDVIADLTSERCMDRLICGDVGFGKTEVAARAAFKVVCDGYQVAILVPTTILSEQHAQTFRERLAGFPVTVDCLNRFRSAAEQRQIIADAKGGKIDIIIGTHRLLSKDVGFSRLGLLIIDEEHRFGVTHKERLKLLRADVDVLTLTATPIPRTLQMSLLGVRDLSLIQTPPRHRRSVKTFVAEYDDLVIKEAVVRELQRGGQVFLVHNRVQSIHEVASKVQKLVPDARIAVAHGQMPGKILEEIMVDFIHKKVDVLICTTIIESGLDIPNANTIIITRADRMGLAGIYQLRGRVGRSSEQAYAYLLVPSMENIGRDARQRMRALMDHNELGGGFKLAMSDLQIRGGGNILGESQSGNIAAVGYDLYLDLLQQTVEDLKRQASDEKAPPEIEIEPEISLNISAFISEKYIPDPDQRYIAYRRIAALKSAEGALDLENEFIDRYGKLPAETKNLLETVSLKEELKPLKITKLEQGPANLVFSFAQETPVSPQQILIFIKSSPNHCRLLPDSRLVVEIAAASTESIFARVKKILHAIW
ncbi:MAG: transcription-repair coupling factor [Deltaproteobacteria bacterium]|nr:transcription-repair coupling factor [Deltaproteobacteria bacterium]